MERSWRPPRPKQSARERLLAGPKRFPRQISAILEAKRLPKVSNIAPLFGIVFGIDFGCVLGTPKS